MEELYILSTKIKDVEIMRNLYYYCVNHRTTKTSEILIDNGNKKRINICNARIKYDKNLDQYCLLENHSKECKELKKEFSINYLEIKEEISNYQNFSDSLKKFMNTNPNITFIDFKKYAQNLYIESNNKFNLPQNYYSNLYYGWRKTSNNFKKYSIFDNQLTKEGTQFLKDYCSTMLYNKSNNTQFEHEHVIYISDYFIKKLNNSSHYYIDGTFIHPPDFKQLIVILYYDEIINKRMAGMFALINNKKENGYLHLFKRINDILTIENSTELKLSSYTVDFEKGLINALNIIYPDIKCIGCYFHYTRALKKKRQELGFSSKNKYKIIEPLLKDLYRLPFIFYKDNNIIITICENYITYSLN